MRKDPNDTRAYDRARYHGDQVRRRAYYRARHAERRAKVVALLGGKCGHCGFSDPRALQVDHVNGGGNRERQRMGDNTMRMYKHVLEHPEYYQLLCANCNWIKRAENNEMPRAV